MPHDPYPSVLTWCGRLASEHVVAMKWDARVADRGANIFPEFFCKSPSPQQYCIILVHPSMLISAHRRYLCFPPLPWADLSLITGRTVRQAFEVASNAAMTETGDMAQEQQFLLLPASGDHDVALFDDTEIGRWRRFFFCQSVIIMCESTIMLTYHPPALLLTYSR